MIQIENLHIKYPTPEGAVHAVRGINIEVQEGKFYTLLGPSGCGKTSTLRSLAGLEWPEQGDISIGQDVVYSYSKGISVPPHKRDIGMVFQSYAIWPHMNVFNNVAFPLQEMRPRLSKAVIKERTFRVLHLLQLDGLEYRPAPFLSGGQQQRLALARALVREPKVLLLDEPLSNLDAKLREDTRVELRQLVKRLGITTVYVTHDQLEALTMSDTVAVMNQGRIVQEAPPMEIYRTPKEKFVANFIGLTNFLQGKVTSLPNNGASMGTVETDDGPLHCVLPEAVQTGDAVVVVIRPEDVRIDSGQASDTENVFEGEITTALFMGESVEYQATLGTTTIKLKLHPSTAIERGDRVRFKLPAQSCRALAT